MRVQYFVHLHRSGGHIPHEVHERSTVVILERPSGKIKVLIRSALYTGHDQVTKVQLLTHPLILIQDFGTDEDKFP